MHRERFEILMTFRAKEALINVQCNVGFKSFVTVHYMEDEEGRRRPSAINNDQLSALVEADASKTVRGLLV